jgi:hypothetical protein
MLKRMLLCSGLLLFLVLPLPAQSLLTPGEESGYSRYTQHEDILQFLSLLTARSKSVQVVEIGRTLAVEGYPAKSLLLCVLTAEGFSRPSQLDRTKPTLLITASQHGSEQSAKEAALALIRDLAVGDLQPLLGKLNFLIIPQANPWGNRFDRRVNELELDMNRDHIKMESQGVQAVHRAFRAWMPEVTLDLHERSDSYYRISMGCVSNINIDPSIQEFSRRVILAAVEKDLAEHQITFHEYTVTSENMPSDASGADFTPEELKRWPQITRYSTSDLNDGRNSLGIYQTFSFIQEGASRHDLATLAARSRWQINSLRAFIKAIAHNGQEMTARVRELRSQLLASAGSFSQVHLRMEYRRDSARPELRLLEFQADKPVAGILKADKKAGEAVSWLELESPGRGTQKVGESIDKEWYPLVAPTLSVAPPIGYVIPAQHSGVIETLRLHDIEMMSFTQDVQLNVEGCRVEKVVPSKFDYVPPDTLQVTRRPLTILCKRGDVYIPIRQPAACLLPCLLEPESDYGLIRYWKYDLVPAAGEFFAVFRVTTEQHPPVIPYQTWPR